MDLLGHVDHAKIGAEGTDDLEGDHRGGKLKQALQFRTGTRFLFATPLRH